MTPLRRKTGVLLAMALGIGTVAAVWDWNWFRGAVAKHLSERSGRPVDLGDLHVRFDGLNPTVRLRDVSVPNAEWVRGTAGHPFVKAREVAFTFAWRSLLQGRPVVSHLLLVDADVSLERQANGLRNWRLRTPDDREAGKFRFLRLEARRSTLRFVHESAGLDLRTRATDLATAMPVDQGAPLTTRIEFDGTYRGAAFAGVARTSRVLTFRDTGEPFTLHGEASAGKTRAEVTGQVTDLFTLAGVDADVHLVGPTLADLRGLLPQSWPHTTAFDARARLAKTGDLWAFTALQARVGRSDVSGQARYNGEGDRPFLEATLASRVTRIADVWPPRPKQAGQAEDGAADKPLNLRPFDADVTVDVDTLHVPALPPLTQVRARARLDDGQLDITPVQAQVAGGTAQGRLDVDGRADVPTARAELSWRNLRLEQLLPPLPGDGEATGPVSGQLRLASRGASWQLLVAQASGQGSALLRGGRLSAALDAKLALNGGKLLRAKVASPPDVPIVCARVDVVLRDGRGDVFPLVLDTAQTRVDGRGEVDLRGGRFDLLLTPSPKQAALLALRQSIRVAGPFDAPRTELVKAEPFEQQARCDAATEVKAPR